MPALPQQQQANTLALRGSLEQNLMASLGTVFSEFTGCYFKAVFQNARDDKVTKSHQTVTNSGHDLGKKVWNLLRSHS